MLVTLVDADTEVFFLSFPVTVTTGAGKFSKQGFITCKAVVQKATHSLIGISRAWGATCCELLCLHVCIQYLLKKRSLELVKQSVMLWK